MLSMTTVILRKIIRLIITHPICHLPHPKESVDHDTLIWDSDDDDKGSCDQGISSNSCAHIVPFHDSIAISNDESSSFQSLHHHESHLVSLPIAKKKHQISVKQQFETSSHGYKLLRWGTSTVCPYRKDTSANSVNPSLTVVSSSFSTFHSCFEKDYS